MKRFGIILSCVLAFSLFAGCSNGLSRNNDSGKTDGAIVVRGSFNSPARSAMFSKYSLVLSVNAQKGEQKVDAVVEALDFYITLPEAGEWTFNAVCKNAAGDTVFTATESKTITTDYSADILLKAEPVENSTLKGSVRLTVEDTSKKVSKMVVSCSSNQALDKEIGFADKTLISVSEIAPGDYTIVLKFYDAQDKFLYSCTELITVYAGLCTDTWYNNSNSDYIQMKNGKYCFVLTGVLLK